MESVNFTSESYEIEEYRVQTAVATPYEKPGDALYTYFAKDLSVMSVLDGVSSSKSPFESSKMMSERLSEFFSGKRSLDFSDYFEHLSHVNAELLKKDYASTCSQVFFYKEKIHCLNIGDSQVVLFDHDENIVFESWPQNQGFSNREDNENAHILLNWLGNTHLRFELTIFDQNEVKAGVIFSDGFLDLFKPSKSSLKDLKSFVGKGFIEVDHDSVLDDSSFIFFER